MWTSMTLSVGLLALVVCVGPAAAQGQVPTIESCRQRRGTDFNQTESCCNVTTQHFRQNWSREGNYLTEYLADLRDWGCPQFTKECSKPAFRFTAFTELVYSLYCNPTRFNESCGDVIRRVVPSSGGNSPNELRSLKLNSQQLAEPCVQVQLYRLVTQARGSPYGYFHEIKREFVPFCDFTWCGLDSQNVNDNFVNAWICMNTRCRANIIVVIVVCSLLAIISFVVNSTSLAVFIREKDLRNSQGVFKLSLSVADLLCAVFIYTTFANSLAKVSMSRETMGPPANGSSVLTSGGRYDSVARLPGGDAWSHFDQPYLDFTGFFTSLYITTTIYTLGLASGERIKFFRDYLAFSKDSAKWFAIKSSIVCWIVGIIIAIPSLFVNRYSLIASIMVLSSGETAVYLYIIAYGLPILALWILSLVALCLSLRRSKPWRHSCVAVTNEMQKTLSDENRQARTLNIMVGVFSALLILGSMSIVAGLVTQSANSDDPDRIDHGKAAVAASFEFVAILLLVSNNLWNFFIYYGRDARFKQAVKNLYAAICCGSATPSEGGQKHHRMEETAPPNDSQVASDEEATVVVNSAAALGGSPVSTSSM